MCAWARAFPEGWNDDVFVPLGFEGDGAWGPRAQWAFDQGVAAKAEVEKDKEGDWNEMSFGEYWEGAHGCDPGVRAGEGGGEQLAAVRRRAGGDGGQHGAPQRSGRVSAFVP